MSNKKVWMYYNGKPMYSRDEYIFTKRGFKEIISDEFLLKYAEKVTYGWSQSGQKQTFTSYWLGSYCLDHPISDLTDKEYARLKELQEEARAEAQRIEDEKEWRYDHTIFWADNSEEEIWINKYGEKKSVMTVAPHGDVC